MSDALLHASKDNPESSSISPPHTYAAYEPHRLLNQSCATNRSYGSSVVQNAQLMELGLLPGTTSCAQCLSWLIEQLMAVEPDQRSETDKSQDSSNLPTYTRL